MYWRRRASGSKFLLEVFQEMTATTRQRSATAVSRRSLNCDPHSGEVLLVVMVVLVLVVLVVLMVAAAMRATTVTVVTAATI